MIKHLTTALLASALVFTAAGVTAKPDKSGDLPPGLQKKVQRGGELPPGWKKKLQPGYVLEDAIYRHAVVVHPVDSRGLFTVRIEGELVRLVHATHEIVDILSR